jgi:hypothetical protein
MRVATFCNKVGLCPATPTDEVNSVQIAANLFDVNATHQLPALKTIFRQLHLVHSCDGSVINASSLVAMLLILSGLETNPGPIIQFGSINARSIVNKGPPIEDMIISHRLDVLAVCKMLIIDSDLGAVKLDAVPQRYAAVHVPHPYATLRSHGGGACIMYRESFVVKAHALQRTIHSWTIECQLLMLHVSGYKPSDEIVLVVIYQLLSASLPAVFDELSETLIQLNDVIDANCLILCSAFNCPGADSLSVHDDMTSLLDVHGLHQFVVSPTRRTLTFIFSNCFCFTLSRSESNRYNTFALDSFHQL